MQVFQTESYLSMVFLPAPLGLIKLLLLELEVYFKESLPIKERCELEIIPETIVAERKFNRKKILIVLSYVHPNLPDNGSVEILS